MNVSFSNINVSSDSSSMTTPFHQEANRQSTQTLEECKSLIILEESKNGSELPRVVVPPSQMQHAEHYGIHAGLQLLLGNNPALNAAAAITMMESFHKRGYYAAVRAFAREKGMLLAQELGNISQKVEFLTRVAKLMPDDERAKWRDVAVDLLSHQEGYSELCLSHSLIELATLFAEASDVDQTLHWLKQTNARRETYQSLAALFFKKGLFEEGLKIWDADSLFISHPISKESGLNNQDFLEFLVSYLKHKGEIKETACRQVFAQFQNSPDQMMILIKALCYVGKSDQALEFAQQLSLQKKDISFLLQFHQYASSKSNVFETIIEVSLKLPHSYQAIQSICRSKQFSLTEMITACAALDSAAKEVPLLLEIVNEMALKQPKTSQDLQDLLLLLSIIRNHLTQFSPNDYQGNPSSPYWIQVLKSYMEYGLTLEALNTGQIWKNWYPCSPNLKRVEGDIWFLSMLGILEISAGFLFDGLSDLEQAYQLQQDTWRVSADKENKFYHSIREAITLISSTQIGENGLSEMAKQKILAISVHRFDYDALAKVFDDEQREAKK
jgi:hypothetical protein